MANPKKLTQKQEAFAQAFVLGIDGDASTANNASAAYRHAYSTKNMSADSVRVEANKLENHPNISLRISELQEAKKKKAEKRNETTIDLIDGMHKAAFKIAKQVSIHAPREGRDQIRPNLLYLLHCFNPRAPRRARQS